MVKTFYLSQSVLKNKYGQFYFALVQVLKQTWIFFETSPGKKLFANLFSSDYNIQSLSCSIKNL